MINVNLERGGAQAENAGELEKDGSRFEMSNSNLRVNTLKRNKYKEFWILLLSVFCCWATFMTNAVNLAIS